MKARPWNQQGHEGQALVAKVAEKAWLWPCLPGLAGRDFGQAPDARGVAKQSNNVGSSKVGMLNPTLFDSLARALLC